MTDESEVRITVNSTVRNGRTRYCYVVHRTGYGPFVSTYRFKTEKAARKAGEMSAASNTDFLRYRRENP